VRDHGPFCNRGFSEILPTKNSDKQPHFGRSKT
jgi:hypothetical protein